MRNRYYTMILIATQLVMYGCNHTATLSEQERQLVISEASSMLKQYHDAVEVGGLTAEFEYLDQSEEFFWVPPGYHEALNYDSVRSILEQNSKAIEKVSFSWERLTVLPLSDEIASYNGIVVGNMTDTTGQQSDVRIIESGVVIKRSSGWKLLSGQSAVLPQIKDTLEVQ